MGSRDAPKLFWEIRPYSEEDVRLSKKLLSGELAWGDLIQVEKYKVEEPITYLVLFGTLLQIGFGWARPVPITEDSANQTLDQLALLLVSSFFRNFPYQNIFPQNQSPRPERFNPEALISPPGDCSLDQPLVKLKEARPITSLTDPASPPFKIQKELYSCAAIDFRGTDTKPSPNVEKGIISTVSEGSEMDSATSKVQKPPGCHAIFPKSLIYEDPRGQTSSAPMRLNALAKNFWKTEGQPFRSNHGESICSLASEIFVSMKTPARTSPFDYDINKVPRALAIEALGKMNRSLDGPGYHRSQRVLIDGYVFVVCHAAVNDKAFNLQLNQRYVMPESRLIKILHDYTKLVTVWEKRAPLGRMNPRILNKVFSLKVNDIKTLAAAIALLFSSELEA